MVDREEIKVFICETAKKTTSNPAISSLWSQFDTVVECIKKQVASSSKFVYEGSTNQRSRTRKQMVERRRNQLKTTTTVSDSDVISPHVSKSAVPPIVITQSTCNVETPEDEDSDAEIQRPVSPLECNDDRNDDTDTFDMLDDDPGGDGSPALSPLRDEDKNSIEKMAGSKPAEKTIDCDIPEHSASSKTPECPEIKTLTETQDHKDKIIVAASDPGTPVKQIDSNLTIKTPVKQVVNVDKGTERSPRRKRPPKRKSQGELQRQNQSDSLMHGNQNESSNSTDGSVTESSLPQILEHILNDPLLPHKLAENINKSLYPEVIPDPGTPMPLPNIDVIPDSPFLERPLEDILDQQETQMPASSINGIIEITEKDPTFGWLFSAGYSRVEESAHDRDYANNGHRSRSSVQHSLTYPQSTATTNNASQPSTSSKQEFTSMPEMSFAGLTSDFASTGDFLPLPQDNDNLFNISMPNFSNNQSSITSTFVPVPQYSTTGSVPVTSQYSTTGSVPVTSQHLCTTISTAHQPMASCITTQHFDSLTTSKQSVTNGNSVCYTSVTTQCSITTCVTAQPLATGVTSHQPLASQPLSQPITTAVTSLQPITSSSTSSSGNHSNVTIQSTVTSPHGFPVLSLKSSVNDDDLPDPLSSFTVQSPAKATDTTSDVCVEQNDDKQNTSSASYTSFLNAVDDGQHSSTPITGHTSSAVILPSVIGGAHSKTHSVVTNTSPKSLPTVKVQSLLDQLEAKAKGEIVDIESNPKPVTKKSGGGRGRRKNRQPPTTVNAPKPVQPKPLAPVGGGTWSPELSALVKIASPVKEKSSGPVTQRSKVKHNIQAIQNTDSASKGKNTRNNKKGNKTFMAVLSPSGKTVHHVPVLEVNSLSEFDDLVPMGQLVPTDMSLTSENSTAKSQSQKACENSTMSVSPHAQVSATSLPNDKPDQQLSKLSSVSSLTSSQVSMATSLNDVQSNLLLSDSALLSMPLLSSTSCVSTTLTSSRATSSQTPSDSPNPKSSTLLRTECMDMPDLFDSAQSCRPVSKQDRSDSEPKRLSVLNDIYSADRDFLESPSSDLSDTPADSTVEEFTEKASEDLNRYCGISVDKYTVKEVHVRSLDFGSSASRLSSNKAFKPQEAMSPVRQLSFGRGRKNPGSSEKKKTMRPRGHGRKGKNQGNDTKGENSPLKFSSSEKQKNCTLSGQAGNEESVRMEVQSNADSEVVDSPDKGRQKKIPQYVSSPYSENVCTPLQDIECSPASTPNALRICTPSHTEETPAKEATLSQQVISLRNEEKIGAKEIVQSLSDHNPQDKQSKDSTGIQLCSNSVPIFKDTRNSETCNRNTLDLDNVLKQHNENDRVEDTSNPREIDTQTCISQSEVYSAIEAIKENTEDSFKNDPPQNHKDNRVVSTQESVNKCVDMPSHVYFPEDSDSNMHENDTKKCTSLQCVEEQLPSNQGQQYLENCVFQEKSNSLHFQSTETRTESETAQNYSHISASCSSLGTQACVGITTLSQPVNTSVPVVSQYVLQSPTTHSVLSTSQMVSSTVTPANSVSRVTQVTVQPPKPLQWASTGLQSPYSTNSMSVAAQTQFIVHSPATPQMTNSPSPVFVQTQNVCSPATPHIINSPTVISQYVVQSPATPQMIDSPASITGQAQIVLGSPTAPPIGQSQDSTVGRPQYVLDTPAISSMPMAVPTPKVSSKGVGGKAAQTAHTVHSPAAPRKVRSRETTPQMEPADFIPDRTGTIYVTPKVLAQISCEKSVMVQQNSPVPLAQHTGLCGGKATNIVKSAMDRSALHGHIGGSSVGKSPQGQYQSDQDIFAETTDDEVAEIPSILPAPSRLDVITEVSHDIAKIPSLFDTLDGHNNQVITQCENSQLTSNNDSSNCRYFSALSSSNNTSVLEKPSSSLIKDVSHREMAGSNQRQSNCVGSLKVRDGTDKDLIKTSNQNTVDPCSPNSVESDEDIDILGDWDHNLSTEEVRAKSKAEILPEQTIIHGDSVHYDKSQSPPKKSAWQVGFATKPTSTTSAFVKKMLEQKKLDSITNKKRSVISDSQNKNVALNTQKGSQTHTSLKDMSVTADAASKQDTTVTTDQQRLEKAPRRVQVITLSKEVSKVNRNSQSTVQSARGPFKHPHELTPVKPSHSAGGKLNSHSKNLSSGEKKFDNGHSAEKSQEVFGHQQYITPPKKRFTASLKNGSGLYFVSSSEKQNIQDYSRHSNEQNSLNSSQSTNSPRRSRKSTPTPRKDFESTNDCQSLKSNTNRSSKSPGRSGVNASPSIRRKVFDTSGNSPTKTDKIIDKTCVISANTPKSRVNKSSFSEKCTQSSSSGCGNITVSSCHKNISGSSSHNGSPQKLESPTPKRGHKRQAKYPDDEVKTKKAKKNNKQVDLTKLDVDKFLNSEVYMKGRRKTDK